MSLLDYRDLNKVKGITLDKDADDTEDTFLIHGSRGNHITLEDCVLKKIIKKAGNIMKDLVSCTDRKIIRYLTDYEVSVFTKTVLNTSVNEFFKQYHMRVLCISQKSYKLYCDITIFSKIIALADIIIKLRKSNNCIFSLPEDEDCSSCSSKTIKFDLYEGKFSIFDKDDIEDNSVTFPLLALANMTLQKEDILDKSRKNSYHIKKYWSQGSKKVSLKKIFNFSSNSCLVIKASGLNIYMCEHAYRKLLKIVGNSVWLDQPSEAKITNWTGPIDLGSQKCIELSPNFEAINNKTCTITDKKTEIKIRLPLDALEIMMLKRNEILFDLEYFEEFFEICTEVIYWWNEQYNIQLYPIGKDGYVRFKDLEINKFIMTMSTSTFHRMLEVYKCYKYDWVAKIIMYEEKCRSQGNAHKELNSDKSMEIDVTKNMFRLVDESKGVEANLPLIALAHLRVQLSDILRDLKDDGYVKKIYYGDENCKIKQKECRNFIGLNFEDENGNLVTIRDRTLKYMLNIAMGDPSLGGEYTQMHNRVENNLCPGKNIDFSDDGKTFKITNEYKESYILPMIALDTLFKKRDNILLDFESRINCEVDEVYWTNDSYYISNGRFVNKHRNIDDNVLRFVQRADNHYMWVIKKSSFSKLLELYQQQ